MGSPRGQDSEDNEARELRRAVGSEDTRGTKAISRKAKGDG